MSEEEPEFLLQTGLFEQIRESVSYDETCQIRVCGVEIVRRGLKKHAEYLIVGEDEGGEFKISRRYREFLHLRGMLGSMWPGCYIPQIPPKKVFGNLKHTFIEKRRKLLELFLQKLSSLQFLRKSPAFSAFLTMNTPFLAVSKTFSPPSLETLSHQYKKNFIDTLVGNEYSEIHEYIENSIEQFTFALTLLETLRKKAQKMIETYSLTGKSLWQVFNYLNELSVVYSKFADCNSINIRGRKAFCNPFYLVLDWINAEELDIKAMLEAIANLRILEQKLNITNKKLRELREKLEDFDEGNRSFLQKVSRQSLEQLVEDTEAKLEAESLNSLYLTELTTIITARLGKKDIHRLKAKQWKKLGVMMKVFAIGSIEEFEAYKALAFSISDQVSFNHVI